MTDILDRLVAHGDILLAVLLVANDGMRSKRWDSLQIIASPRPE